MEGGTLGLMDDGSISTVSKEDDNNNMVLLSSEASSSYPDESDLELGLGLGLGLGSAAVSQSISNKTAASWGQYGKILTVKDFHSSSSSCSSSAAAAKVNNNGSSCGTKRTADSISPPRSSVSQVVGWPPIRTYRMNTLQTKSPPTGELSPTEKCKSKNTTTDAGSSKSNNLAKGKGVSKTSLFVKVSMDGVAIGRKVDLNAHSSYENLERTLDNMFLRPSTAVCARPSNARELDLMSETSSSRLLNGSSEFVLTYEDKEGDWMLVGDVPWEMFISSVKRLRIMKSSEANGLGSTSPSFMDRNGRQRTKPM